ncbi:MAG: hypothetical protein ABIQ56_00295 [Chitinophagaceae bacterium]
MMKPFAITIICYKQVAPSVHSDTTIISSQQTGSTFGALGHNHYFMATNR